MPKQANPYPSKRPMNVPLPQVARQAVFEKCRNVSVSGGIFNLQLNSNGSDESDFPNIKLGHLNLMKEVMKQTIVEYREYHHKKTGVVKRCVPHESGVRRIHHARIYGSQEMVTAVVYKDSDFEKHRAHAEQREDFRHPLLVQLLGVISSPRCKALIYHDALIPLDKFRKMHQQSPLVSAFLELEFGGHFLAALNHWAEVTGERLLVHDSYGYLNRLKLGTTLWIRISTGQLCIEVNDNMDRDYTRLPPGLKDCSISLGVHLTSDTNLENRLLSHMSLDDIHHIFYASNRGHWIAISDPGIIMLGSLSWSTASCEYLFNPFSDMSLSNGLKLRDVHLYGWEYSNSYPWGASSQHKSLITLPNGWTRVALADLPIHGECHLWKHVYLTLDAEKKVRKTWLSQANHIRDQLGLDSDADKLYISERVVLQIAISSNVDEFTLQGTFVADSSMDDVYLFLFPTKVDSSGGHLTVHMPPENKSYYWSFDPKGINRLPQDAWDKLTLPRVSFRAKVYGASWRKEIYLSIGEFHHAKGFNTASQDVAIELGYPLMDVDRLDRQDRYGQ